MDYDGDGFPNKAREVLIIVEIAVTAAAAATAFALRGRAPVATGAVAVSAAQAAAEASSRVADEFAALGHAYKIAANTQTRSQAINRYARWTPEEVAVLRDPTMTAVDKALRLGRTFESVRASQSALELPAGLRDSTVFSASIRDGRAGSLQRRLATLS